MENDTRGVHVSAGDGIVAHVANLTAHAQGEEDGINELLVRLNALAGEPWQEIVRSLTSGISDAGYENHPAIACVSVSNDKVAALVFGDAVLSITLDGSETILDGRDSSTWIDVALRGKVERVCAGEQSDSAVVGVLRDGVIPAGGFLLDTSGPIPASGRWSGVVGAPTETSVSAPAPEPVAAPPAVPTAPPAVPNAAEADNAAAPEQPVPEPASAASPAAQSAPAEPNAPLAAAPIASNDDPVAPPTARSMFARIEEIGRAGRALSPENQQPSSEQLFAESPFEQRANPLSETGSDTHGDATQRQTLTPSRPQLKGVLCDAGHLTAPLETSCRTCAAAVPTGANTATGDRPILGTLTFDDGAILNIDRPAAIGADVPSGYVIDGEPATVVRLDDGVGGISDIQLEVRLSGWNVEIVDMYSLNGTYTMLRGERQTRTKLRAGQSVVLQREMEVQTGGRSFVYTVGPNPDGE